MFSTRLLHSCAVLFVFSISIPSPSGIFKITIFPLYICLIFVSYPPADVYHQAACRAVLCPGARAEHPPTTGQDYDHSECHDSKGRSKKKHFFWKVFPNV